MDLQNTRSLFEKSLSQRLALDSSENHAPRQRSIDTKILQGEVSGLQPNSRGLQQNATFQKGSKPFIRFIPLGGMGDVTKNMYVYEYVHGVNKEILIVDCGVGFPDSYMYGIDLVIPDASYVIKNRQFIKGIVLTHGHEDHIAALPFIWPKLQVPIYATRLTGALAQVRLKDRSVSAPITICSRDQLLKLGVFTVEFVHITHSIPDANNLIIRSPVGNFYHGSDYKFDWTPVDNVVTEIGKIVKVSQEGVLSLTTDCLGSDREGYTYSERVIEGGFEKAISKCKGKFIVTTQSSNISRIKQAIDTSQRHGRHICLVGRSVKGNVDVSQKLGYIKLPSSLMITEKDVAKYPPKSVSLIVAGSQGQAESALSRIALGDFHGVRIEKDDIVVFSADPIPGNEEAINNLIDTLSDLGAQVLYSGQFDDLHVSGHGSQNDLMLMLSLVKPKYIIPIGGTRRHMYQYSQLAQMQGYNKQDIFLLDNGQTIEYTSGTARLGKRVEIETIMVDGLGIGDVGNVVLRDRKIMAEDGIVVTIIPLSTQKNTDIRNIDIISRGFVYMKESEELIKETKTKILETLTKLSKGLNNPHFIKRSMEDVIEKLLYKKTHRRPMVIVVLIET